MLGLPPCVALIVRKPSVFQEFLARLLRFLLSEVKPGRGDHFSFLARLFHKLAGGAKPRLRLFPNQGIVTTSHLTASHLILFQPDSLHLDQVGLHLHLVALHPTGCWLHLALPTSWHSLLPLKALAEMNTWLSTNKYIGIHLSNGNLTASGSYSVQATQVTLDFGKGVPALVERRKYMHIPKCRMPTVAETILD